MTLGVTFTEIDELTRPDHFWLGVDDDCCFLGEYTAGEGYTHSETNSLISNFKKQPDRQGRPEWRYKEEATKQAAKAFRRALGPTPPAKTFVPIPPSKARNDRLYDDRLTKMLHAIWRGQTADIREILYQSVSTGAAHQSSERPTPEEIQGNYEIDEELTTPAPTSIAIVDDLLTTGAHFRAASALLAGRFPAVPIVGLFIARRVPKDEDQ